jgi:hypothetical protein
MSSNIVKFINNNNKFNAWTPYSTAMHAWYDASDVGSIIQSSGAVSQIYDKSGNGRHIVQASAPNQPTTGAATLNGLNLISGDGVAKYLSYTAGGSPVLWGGNFGIYMVVVINNATHTVQGGPFCLKKETATYVQIDPNDAVFTGSMRATTIISGTNPAVFTGGPYNNSNRILCVHNIDGGTNIAYVDGVQRASQTNAATNWGPRTIYLLTNNNQGAFFNGSLGEFIITNSDTSLATRQKIEGYLAWKWNLVGNLAGGHPYKNSPP